MLLDGLQRHGTPHAASARLVRTHAQAALVPQPPNASSATPRACAHIWCPARALASKGTWSVGVCACRSMSVQIPRSTAVPSPSVASTPSETTPALARMVMRATASLAPKRTNAQTALTNAARSPRARTRLALTLAAVRQLAMQETVSCAQTSTSVPMQRCTIVMRMPAAITARAATAAAATSDFPGTVSRRGRVART